MYIKLGQNSHQRCEMAGQLENWTNFGLRPIDTDTNNSTQKGTAVSE